MTEVFGKVTRKIIRVGNSLAVTLPKKYVIAHGLEQGDDMDIWYDNVFHGEPVKEEDIRRKLGEEILCPVPTPTKRDEGEKEKGSID